MATTEQQVTQLSAQEAISSNVERSASSLNGIAIDYFLHQEDYLQLPQWNSSLSSLCNDLSELKVSNPQQQELLNKVNNDLISLNQSFADITAYLQNVSRNVSVRIDPAFQLRWSNLTYESQALALHASQLSNSLDTQAHQANDTNIILIVSLVGTFGALLATIYLMVFRRTLKSVAELQRGINTIGSGNLEYVIETKKNDEITELSHAFNHMTANLKNVTASKTDLENEIAGRKKVEQEREIMFEFLKIANSCATTTQLVESTVDFFHQQSGCEAVGIRLKEGEDYPYYESRGFPPEHLQLENKLCARDPSGCIIRDFKGDPVMECMCGNIICGRFDPSKQFFTEKGSFWANDTTRLLATTTDADRQANTRNRCNGEGYESVALLALRVGSNTLGLLQLNDKRKDMFTLETIQKWERIADYLSLALSKTLAEESLRRSEQRWSTTLASIGDAVIATDLSGNVTFMNGIAQELTGRTISEASQKPIKEIFNIVNEQTRKEVENPVNKVLEKGVVVGLANHTILIRKDGKEIAIDDSGAPIKDKDGKTTGVVLIFRDISENKKAEKTLRENEVKFRTVANFTYDWEYWIAPDGNMVYVSPSCKRVTGYEADEFIKDCTLLSKIIHPEDKSIVGSHFDLISSDELHAVDFRILTRSGETRWISHSCKAVFDDNGKWIGRRASNRDITESKSAEEALRESELRLRFHAENIPLAVVEWDRNFVVTRWAGDAEKMFGWNASETVGKPIMDLNLIYEPDIPIVEKTMGKLTSGETKVVSSNRNVTKDGKVIYCTWYNSVLLDENGKMTSVFSFVEDYTSRMTAEKALEEANRNLENLVEDRTKQLRDSERLAAIGATAGMVGHDIRNPLQAITGDVYLAKTELAEIPESPEKKNALESLQEIEKNIEYINKIVADLQDFARPLKPHVEETDLKQIFSELLAKNGMPQNIKVSVKVDAEARKVMADCAYINRIMYNLVTNAIQAMPKGGKLNIHAFKDKKTDEAVITVADTGVGIPEAVKGKLFTPMFTTKSKGQGFGLAVIKRMAEALSGSVVFESEEGNGTKFIVRLPQNVKKKTDF